MPFGRVEVHGQSLGDDQYLAVAGNLLQPLRTAEERAQEIAARTVSKYRARSGESRRSSNVSTEDVSPQHRGGKRSGAGRGLGGPTKARLYNDAKNRSIKGRSKMTKRQLQNALAADAASRTSPKHTRPATARSLVWWVDSAESRADALDTS